MTENADPTRETDATAARVVGRSFYRELRSNGYTPKELLVLCTELIALITKDVPVNGASAGQVRAESRPV